MLVALCIDNAAARGNAAHRSSRVSAIIRCPRSTRDSGNDVSWLGNRSDERRTVQARHERAGIHRIFWLILYRQCWQTRNMAILLPINNDRNESMPSRSAGGKGVERSSVGAWEESRSNIGDIPVIPSTNSGFLRGRVSLLGLPASGIRLQTSRRLGNARRSQALLHGVGLRIQRISVCSGSSARQRVCGGPEVAIIAGQ